MNARKITSISILLLIASCLGLEAWLLSNKEQDDTISEVIHEASRKWIVIPFLAGLLSGHWFWPIYNKKGE